MAAGTPKSIERPGATIGYETRGDGERAIVFAHNLFTSRAIWADVATRLASRFRTVAIDLRGHGASTGVRAPFTTKDLAADLVAVLDVEKLDRATFVGVSLGASASMEATLAHPSRVERLVVMGATARAATRRDRVMNEAAGLLARTAGMKVVARQATSVLFAPSFGEERPAAFDEWKARIAAMSGTDAAHAMHAWTTRAPLRDRLASVRVPSLVVVGDRDVPCPREHSEELLAALSDAAARARLEIVARAGHTLPLERPDEVHALLDRFL